MVKLYKSPVVFREDNHTYWLGNKQLMGVTSTLIKRAFPNKYSEVPPEVLAKAAEKGHALHALIEFHDSFNTACEEHADPRIASYERLKQENGLTTIANEYLVSDEERYASSIDIVMVNEAGEICIVDTKTTWNLDKQSVALQLSIYKRFFEKQNPTLHVSHLYALWLPNKDYTIAEMPELKPVADEIIDSLIEADKNDTSFDIVSTYGSLPATLSEVEDEIIRIEKSIKECEARRDKLKSGLYGMMEKFDIKSFKGSKVKLTRVLPSTSKTFDTARFAADYPDLYNQYIKTTQRSGSLKITIS